MFAFLALNVAKVIGYVSKLDQTKKESVKLEVILGWY